MAEQVGLSVAAICQMKGGSYAISDLVWDSAVMQLRDRVATLQSMLLGLQEGLPDDKTSKHALLERLGVSLYGQKWCPGMVADLAEIAPDLFVNERCPLEDKLRGNTQADAMRKLKRMAAGKQPTPPSVWPALRKAIRQRQSMLTALRSEVVRKGRTPPSGSTYAIQSML